MQIFSWKVDVTSVLLLYTTVFLCTCEIVLWVKCVHGTDCYSLQAIGNGAIAQSVLGHIYNNNSPQFGDFLSINFGYALALMVALYISIGVSGGHLNPAVTLAMALRGKMSWIKVPAFFYFWFCVCTACIMCYKREKISVCGQNILLVVHDHQE